MEQEKRGERRARFSWPLWFGYEETGRLFTGQVIDLSCSAVSFGTTDANHPQVGQHVVTRFSFPRDAHGTLDVGSYRHWSEVIRVDDNTAGGKRIVLRLHQRLEKQPSNQPDMTMAAISA